VFIVSHDSVISETSFLANYLHKIGEERLEQKVLYIVESIAINRLNFLDSLLMILILFRYFYGRPTE